jgi:hypothetical protein
MKTRCILEIFALIASADAALGSVIDERTIEIDLTDTNAASQCEWVPADRYAITKKGLGWEGDPGGQQANGGEILTHPVGVGYWHRPTTSVHIRAELSPGPQKLTDNDGHSYYADPGHMYARHSPDRQHWSSWQALTSGSRTNRVYEGELAIPGRERYSLYERLRLEYAQRDDAPWPDDEEAAVRWIVSWNPEFFATNLPFIGYVQLLFEGRFPPGRRLKTFKAELSWSMGGLGFGPMEDDHVRLSEEELMMPWRFSSTAPGGKPGAPAPKSEALGSRILVEREVHAPGAYPWTNGMRLTDAIACAGGLTDLADRNRVRLSHADGEAETCLYDFALKNKSEDPVLRPGERVYVHSQH